MLTPSTAVDILQRAEAPIGGDFDALRSHQVMTLLDAAQKHKYRHPKNANGSKGRYFHAYLQRRAAKDAVGPAISSARFGTGYEIEA